MTSTQDQKGELIGQRMGYQSGVWAAAASVHSGTLLFPPQNDMGIGIGSTGKSRKDNVAKIC